jgi:citrate synthase
LIWEGEKTKQRRKKKRKKGKEEKKKKKKKKKGYVTLEGVIQVIDRQKKEIIYLKLKKNVLKKKEAQRIHVCWFLLIRKLLSSEERYTIFWNVG